MAERGRRKRLAGTVISNRMDRTAVVQVERLAKHPEYKKYIRRRAKYLAHDAENRCQIGDQVQIVESRPHSKRKRWRVVTVVKPGSGGEATGSNEQA